MHDIDYGAISNNATFFKALIADKKLCCVVKSDAYGHNLAKTCAVLSNIADCFAVGNVQEAKICLSFGNDILILLPLDKADTVWAISNNCILTIDSLHTLFIVEKCAKLLNKQARVHIKIDSGMHRLGLSFTQLEQFVLSLDPSISVEGVYSHFYIKDEAICDNQLTEFLRCSNYLQGQFDYPLTRHIANTWATAKSPKYHLDMVRVGLGIYGYGVDGLVTAKSVWGRVVALRNLKKGECVGYDGAFVADKDCRIAIVDTGYSSGLARVLTGTKLSVGGKKCLIVGNVCMSMCFVDVTDAQVGIGDRAYLLCKENNLSNDCVIIYEMLCNLQ